MSGACASVRSGEIVRAAIETGGCFGEAAFAEGSRRDPVIEAEGAVTLLKVTATLLEQASISCQLRFNKVFLRELVGPAAAGQEAGGIGG